MKIALLARRSGIVVAVLALFIIFCYILFPTGKIDAVLGRVLLQQGLTLSPSVHKTLLPGLAWDNFLPPPVSR